MGLSVAGYRVVVSCSHDIDLDPGHASVYSHIAHGLDSRRDPLLLHSHRVCERPSRFCYCPMLGRGRRPFLFGHNCVKVSRSPATLEDWQGQKE